MIYVLYHFYCGQLTHQEVVNWPDCHEKQYIQGEYPHITLARRSATSILSISFTWTVPNDVFKNAEEL
jgi:hypothetical protein